MVSRRRSILLNNEGYLLTEYNKNLLKIAAANVEAEKKRVRVETAAARKQAKINKQNNNDTGSLILICNMATHTVNLTTS